MLESEKHAENLPAEPTEENNDMVDANENHSQEANKGGRPPHVPDSDTRNRVYELSKVGTRYEDIATLIGISNDTMKKYYKEELDKGRIEANAIIAGTLFEQAKEGNTSAAIFWLKTRARWKETTTHEVGGDPDGAPVQIKVVTGIE